METSVESVLETDRQQEDLMAKDPAAQVGLVLSPESEFVLCNAGKQPFAPPFRA